MANNRIAIRRTSTAGKVPTTSDINTGELGLNLTDGILYSSNGSVVFEIGANNTNAKVTGNLTVNAIVANGSSGSSGQVLKSNGSSTYWGTDNADVGSNNQVLYRNSSNVLTSSSGLVYDGVSLKVNGNLESVYHNGDEGGEIFLQKPDTNTTLASGITIDVYQNKLRFFENGGSNRGAYIDITAAANGVGTNLLAGAGSGTVSSVASGNGLSGGPITSTGTLSVLANNGITSNSSGVFVKQGTGVVVNATGVHVDSSYIGTLTANNTSFVGAVSAANVVSNAQLSANLANYQTTAGLAANVATLAANSATYLGGNTASDLRTYTDQKAGNAYSNAVSYTDTVIGNVNTAITGNAATAYTNAVSYVDGKSYVNTSQLSSNLSNYAALSGATFTGAVVVSNDFTVTGNLTLSGNTVIVGANNLVVADAVISLHTPANLSPLTSNDGKNIGLAFHYYDTEDRHALLYRDNSTGYLQYHTDGSDPLTNSNPTGNSLGTIQANSFWAGNSTVYSTVNATNYTGTSNNSTYAFSKTESNLNVNNALTANNSDYLQGYQVSSTQTGNTIALRNSSGYLYAQYFYHTHSVTTRSTDNVFFSSTDNYIRKNNSTGFKQSLSLDNVENVALSSWTGSANISIVNTAYIATLAANSATYANSSVSNTFTVGTASYFVANGNLGIGTNTPYGLLTLRGYTGGTVGSAVNNYVKTLVIGGAYNNTYNSNNAVLMHIADYSNDAGDNVYPIYVEDENNVVDFYLFAGNNGVGTDKKAYFGGNVGIGNTAPTTKLSVNGTTFLGGNVTISTTAGINANGGYGTAGQVLSSNGTSVYWATAAGGGSVGGSNTYVQFNDSGSFGGNANFTFNKTTNILYVANSIGAGPGLSSPAAVIHANGNIYATGDMVSAYSDERLKDVVGAIPNALDKVSALTGFYYTPNKIALNMGLEDNQLQRVGVSAQQVREVLPEVVRDAPVGQGYLTVQYDKIVPLLIEAIKELREEVRILKETK